MPIPDTITVIFDRIEGTTHRATLVESPDPSDPLEGKSDEGRGAALIELAHTIDERLD